MPVQTIRIDPVRSKSPQVRKLVAELRQTLIEDCYKREPNHRAQKKLYDSLKTIVLLLYEASRIGADCCLAVPHDRALYLRKSRLGRLHFSRNQTVKSIKWLVKSEYAIKERSGIRFTSDKASTKQQGHTTCYKATAKLIELIQAKAINLEDFEIDDERPSVELRNADGAPIHFEDNDETQKTRDWLSAYNQLLCNAYIDWDEVLGTEPNSRMPNKRAKKVRRVFKHSLQKGGRFYGGFWQNLAEREKINDPYSDAITYRKYSRRPHIYINGEHTAELDFKAIHPALMYAMSGQDYRPMSGIRNGSYDLYASIRFSEDADKDRNLAKLAVLIGVNALSKDKAYRALRSEITKRREDFPHLADKLNNTVFDELFRTIYLAHPIFEEFFCKGVGVDLQYLDSCIAEKVLQRFTLELGIPCLSIHDSFLVPASEANTLADIMHDSFMQVAASVSPTQFPEYGIMDILSADECWDASHIPLAHLMSDEQFQSVYNALEMNCEEVAIAAAGGYGEEGRNRPILQRINRWRVEGNTLPFD